MALPGAYHQREKVFVVVMIREKDLSLVASVEDVMRITLWENSALSRHR
jgi:hypothetical protein